MSDAKLDYLVVEFADDERVAVIASNWLEGTQCTVWPPYADDMRIRNAAKRREVPGDAWKAFPIKVPIHYETDDWDKAIRKCLKLEKSGTVESTDPEDLGRSKRQKRSPMRFGRSSSPSQTSLWYKRIRYIPSASESESSGDESSHSVTVSTPVPPPAPTRIVQAQGHRKSGGSSSGTFTPSKSWQTAGVRIKACSGPSVSQACIQPDSNSTVPITTLEPILNRIFTAIEEIKVDIRTLKKGRCIESSGSCPSSELPLDTFPVKNLQELFHLEEQLQDQEFMGLVVRTISVFSGRNLKEEVYNVMRNILHNDVVKAFNLSGKGQKQKRAFQALRLYKVVRTAIFKHFPETVDQDFRDKVSDYLGGAGDRDGGRKMRQERNN